MAKKGRAKAKAMVRGVVTTARHASAKSKQIAKKSQALMTPAAGASIAAGAAFGSVLGSRIVASGHLTPNQTGALFIAAGAGTTYAGYRYESPILFGAGLGTGVAGISMISTSMYLRSEERKVRNAGYLPPYEDDDDREDTEE